VRKRVVVFLLPKVVGWNYKRLFLSVWIGLKASTVRFQATQPITTFYLKRYFLFITCFHLNYNHSASLFTVYHYYRVFQTSFFLFVC